MKTNSPVAGFEPVPQLSQLIALSFLSALAGILKVQAGPQFKCTLHRVMTRAGHTYLQQVCDYLPIKEQKPPDPDSPIPEKKPSSAGRIFGLGTGIMGRAFNTAKPWRTKRFATIESLENALQVSMKTTRDNRSLAAVGRSWLAIPFLSKSGKPVLIFYAESEVFNHFADDNTVNGITAACEGFCELLNGLVTGAISIARNPALPMGQLAEASDTAYPDLQEEFRRRVDVSLEFDSFNFGG